MPVQSKTKWRPVIGITLAAAMLGQSCSTSKQNEEKLELGGYDYDKMHTTNINDNDILRLRKYCVDFFATHDVEYIARPSPNKSSGIMYIISATRPAGSGVIRGIYYGYPYIRKKNEYDLRDYEKARIDTAIEFPAGPGEFRRLERIDVNSDHKYEILYSYTENGRIKSSILMFPIVHRRGGKVFEWEILATLDGPVEIENTNFDYFPEFRLPDGSVYEWDKSRQILGKR